MAAKNQVFVQEPPDEPEKKGPLSSKTKLIFASMRVEAAKDPNRSSADREPLLKMARDIYQEVLAAEPYNVDAILGLGQLYVVSGEMEKQQEIEHKAIKLHPKDPKVWEWVAIHQAQRKDWEGACDSYQHAVKLDPDNRMYRKHLGFTLARAGRYTEGYEWLNRSMREPEARYNLAMMMVHNGDLDKAKMELRLALRADPNFQAAGERLASLQKAEPNGGSDIRTVGHQERR
jgi:tetratricopeptide (TPR) repeat protein